jgi:hypothetical protein
MATVLAEQARAAGVTITLRQVDSATFFGPDYLHWPFSCQARRPAQAQAPRALNACRLAAAARHPSGHAAGGRSPGPGTTGPHRHTIATVMDAAAGTLTRRGRPAGQESLDLGQPVSRSRVVTTSASRRRTAASSRARNSVSAWFRDATRRRSAQDGMAGGASAPAMEASACRSPLRLARWP